MATYRDDFSQEDPWLDQLARLELSPQGGAESPYSLDPNQKVEESTIECLGFLRDKISKYAKTLNAFSDHGTKFSEIKIYNIAQSAADFMVFRNQVKLAITHTAHGVVQFQFSKHQTPGLEVNRNSSSEVYATPQELHAAFGPFQDVHWTFQGEKVDLIQVARYFFSEFVRFSRKKSESNGRNQAFFEHIQSLLNSQGRNF